MVSSQVVRGRAARLFFTSATWSRPCAYQPRGRHGGRTGGRRRRAARALRRHRGMWRRVCGTRNTQYLPCALVGCGCRFWCAHGTSSDLLTQATLGYDEQRGAAAVAAAWVQRALTIHILDYDTPESDGAPGEESCRVELALPRGIVCLELPSCVGSAAAAAAAHALAHLSLRVTANEEAASARTRSLESALAALQTRLDAERAKYREVREALLL